MILSVSIVSDKVKTVFLINRGGSAGFKIIIALAFFAPPTFSSPNAVVFVNSSIFALSVPAVVNLIISSSAFVSVLMCVSASASEIGTQCLSEMGYFCLFAG